MAVLDFELGRCSFQNGAERRAKRELISRIVPNLLDFARHAGTLPKMPQ
jgi:hypothetical protein